MVIVPDLGHIVALKNQYPTRDFGATGQIDALLTDKHNFLEFRRQAFHGEWTTLNDVVHTLFPELSDLIVRRGIEHIERRHAAGIDDTLFESTPNIVKGHEREENFETGLEQDIKSVFERHLDTFLRQGYAFKLRCEHNPTSDLIGDEKKAIELGRLVHILYDPLDGQKNFLEELKTFYARHKHQTLAHASQFLAYAATAIAFSLPQYPNFVFASAVYSYASQRLYTFHRQNYGIDGDARVREKNQLGTLTSSILRPVPSGNRIVNFIIPDYNCAHSRVIGALKESIQEYYARFGYEVDVSLGSKTTTIDLENMLRGIAAVSVDARGLLPRRNPTKEGGLFFEDVQAVVPVMSGSRFICLKTEGTPFSEISMPGSQVHPQENPVDLLVINPYAMPKSSLDPSPIDAVNFGRLKMFQELYDNSELGIPTTQKIYNRYRLFTGVTRIKSKAIPGVYIESPVSEVGSLVASKAKEHYTKLMSFANSTGVPDNFGVPGVELRPITECLDSIINDELTPFIAKQEAALTASGVTPQNKLQIYNTLIRAYANIIALEGLRQENTHCDFSKYINRINRYTATVENHFKDAEELLRPSEHEWSREVLRLRRDMAFVYSNLSGWYSRLFHVSSNPSTLPQPQVLNADLARQVSADYEGKDPHQMQLESFRFNAIRFSQLAVDYDPFNFHLIKQHATNFMLAENREGIAYLLMHEALERGKELNGVYSCDYARIIVDILTKLEKKQPGSVKQILPQHLKTAGINYYQRIADETLERSVEQLKTLSASTRYFGHFWQQMRADKLTSEYALNHAIAFMCSTDSRRTSNSDDLLSILALHAKNSLYLYREMEHSGGSKRLFFGKDLGVTGLTIPSDRELADTDIDAIRKQLNAGRDIVFAVYDPDHFNHCRTKRQEGDTDYKIVQSELSALTTFRHDHIVRILHSDIAHIGGNKNVPYMVYDFIDGPNFEELKRPFGYSISAGEKVEHLLDIGSAVDYIHARGFIHRDIKLDNLMLGKIKVNGNGNEADNAYIIDFQFVGKAVDGRCAGNSYGSTRYAAPELLYENEGQIELNPSAHATVRTDLYALAASFVYLLHPDQNASKTQVISKEWKDEGVYTSHLDTIIQASMDEIDRTQQSHTGMNGINTPLLAAELRRALAFNQDNRHTSVAEFCDAIRPCLMPYSSGFTSVLPAQSQGPFVQP